MTDDEFYRSVQRLEYKTFLLCCYAFVCTVLGVVAVVKLCDICDRLPEPTPASIMEKP